VEHETAIWLLALPSIVTLIVGLGAVWVAHELTRGRELRAVRLTAYTKWMAATRNMAAWEGPAPAAGSVIEVPLPQRRQAFNDATAELVLVASDEVADAARDYRSALASLLRLDEDDAPVERLRGH
jgi:hypothetical protein